jgi:NTP pyrophosphatase (non-canonical NTP hydrolase)
MRIDLLYVTKRIHDALNSINGEGDHEVAMRLLKVAEEAGELSSAYIGLKGQNPRKGVTHTREDVVDELCDVVLSAMVVLNSFTDSPRSALEYRAQLCAQRLGALDG